MLCKRILCAEITKERVWRDNQPGAHALWSLYPHPALHTTRWRWRGTDCLSEVGVGSHEQRPTERVSARAVARGVKLAECLLRLLRRALRSRAEPRSYGEEGDADDRGVGQDDTDLVAVPAFPAFPAFPATNTSVRQLALHHLG